MVSRRIRPPAVFVSDLRSDQLIVGKHFVSTITWTLGNAQIGNNITKTISRRTHTPARLSPVKRAIALAVMVLMMSPTAAFADDPQLDTSKRGYACRPV